MSKPKNSSRLAMIGVGVNPDVKAELERMAEVEDRPLSYVARRLLEEAIKRVQQSKKSN